jgi:Tfp pilus assembly protein PilP
MKLTTTILVLGMTSGMAWAQAGPTILQNTKDKLHTVQEKKNADIGNALGASQVQTPKPVSGQAAKAPTNTASKPTPVQPAKSAPAQTVKAASTKAPATAKVVPVVVSKPAAKPNAAAVSKGQAKATKLKPETTQSATSQSEVSVESKKASEPSKNERMKTITANGRRDPFISPVVSQSATGSGCSTGKRCLAVNQISLKGVVKAETGMIAVVVNALDKAYFLRENDPVFDGYVLKITTDSIVFKETVQDKLGKPFTREVTKRISTPVV